MLGSNSIKFLMEFQRYRASVMWFWIWRAVINCPLKPWTLLSRSVCASSCPDVKRTKRALALAAGWFRSQLQAPTGQAALAYLTDQRELSPATHA